MYNDLLGKKRIVGKGIPHIDLKIEKTFLVPRERSLPGDPNWPRPLSITYLGVEYKLASHSSIELERLATFLTENFSEYLDHGGLVVDNAIHVLTRALEYELEVCSGCSHKEKLKYLADHDMIKE